MPLAVVADRRRVERVTREGIRARPFLRASHAKGGSEAGSVFHGADLLLGALAGCKARDGESEADARGREGKDARGLPRGAGRAREHVGCKSLGSVEEGLKVCSHGFNVLPVERSVKGRRTRIIDARASGSNGALNGARGPDHGVKCGRNATLA